MIIRRHRAIAQAVEHTPLLPFLYHTRTITRQYATRPDAIEEAFPNRDAPDERHRDSGRRGGASYKEWVDHVPFEGTGRPQDADFEGSTITPSERRAFKSLFELGKMQASVVEDGVKADKAPGRSKLSKLDDIMNAADGGSQPLDFPQPLQRMAKEAHAERRRNAGLSQSDAIAAAAKKDLVHVGNRINAAKTDADLWTILQKHVFKRVLALNLDGPASSKKSRKARRQDHSLEDENTSPKPQKFTPTDLDILTRTLPEHLIHAHRTLTHAFPASPLPLTLLPHLRTLGPTAFALGTSTQLYNLHIRAVWHRTRDLDAILETLREMEREVYSYDEITEALIARVLGHSLGAKKGVWGEGVRTVWMAEGTRRRVRLLTEWRGVVRERRQGEALRVARARAEAGEAEEE